MKILDLFLNFL